LALGISVISTNSISIDTRPIKRFILPSTATGVYGISPSEQAARG
jgi:hypothetical protein